MRCVYCLTDSTGTKSIAHVLPEAIARNDLVLPRGAVCDACNHYLGHELDSVMVAHPVLSLMIQFLRIPGKSGKVRKRVGNVASDAVPSGITIPCAEPKPVVHADGTRSTKVTPLLDPAFDFLRFRRALHHVGFNTLVLRDGVDRAYEGRYDAVRRCVRHPHKGESWPFVQYVELEKGLARDVTVLLLRDPSTEFAGLVLGKAAAFAVDLTNSGGLADLAQSQFPPGAAVIDSSNRVQRAQRETGARRYRVTISIDD